MKFTKRILAVLVALMMTIGLFAVGSLASTPPTAAELAEEAALEAFEAALWGLVDATGTRDELSIFRSAAAQRDFNATWEEVDGNPRTYVIPAVEAVAGREACSDQDCDGEGDDCEAVEAVEAAPAKTVDGLDLYANYRKWFTASVVRYARHLANINAMLDAIADWVDDEVADENGGDEDGEPEDGGAVEGDAADTETPAATPEPNKLTEAQAKALAALQARLAVLTGQDTYGWTVVDGTAVWDVVQENDLPARGGQWRAASRALRALSSDVADLVADVGATAPAWAFSISWISDNIVLFISILVGVVIAVLTVLFVFVI